MGNAVQLKLNDMSTHVKEYLTNRQKISTKSIMQMFKGTSMFKGWHQFWYSVDNDFTKNLQFFFINLSKNPKQTICTPTGWLNVSTALDTLIPSAQSWADNRCCSEIPQSSLSTPINSGVC